MDLVLQISGAVLAFAGVFYAGYRYGRYRMWNDHIEDMIQSELEKGPKVDLDAAKPGYSMKNDKRN